MTLDKIQRTVVSADNPGLREGQITSFDELEVGMELVKVSPGEIYEEYDSVSGRHERLAERESGLDFYCEAVRVGAVGVRLAGGFSLGPEPAPENYSTLAPDHNFIVLEGRGETINDGPQSTTYRSVLSLSKADLAMEQYMVDGKARGWSLTYLRRAVDGERTLRGRSELTSQEIVARFPGTYYL